MVVRTDDERLSREDNHPEGWVVVTGLATRHTAVGRKALCEQYGPREYVVAHEKNDSYEA